MAFAEGRSRPDLDSDEMLRLALVKLVEIVGEAANQVTDGTRARMPGVPWAEAARMRDRSSTTIGSRRESAYTPHVHCRVLTVYTERG